MRWLLIAFAVAVLASAASGKTAEEPLEVLRTVHSFDPCMACACHAFDPSGRKIGVVKVL